jgi:hypothetical protein
MGNIEKSMATLVDNDYNIIELPKYLFPAETGPGSILKISITH